MRAATRHYLGRLCALALLVAAVVIGGSELCRLDRAEVRPDTASRGRGPQASRRSSPSLSLPGSRDRRRSRRRNGTPRRGDRDREVAGMLLYRFAPTAAAASISGDCSWDLPNPTGWSWSVTASPHIRNMRDSPSFARSLR